MHTVVRRVFRSNPVSGNRMLVLQCTKDVDGDVDGDVEGDVEGDVDSDGFRSFIEVIGI